MSAALKINCALFYSPLGSLKCFAQMIKMIPPMILDFGTRLVEVYVTTHTGLEPNTAPSTLHVHFPDSRGSNVFQNYTRSFSVKHSRSDLFCPIEPGPNVLKR